MKPICINCPGHLTGDCATCAEMEDPCGGDYEEDSLEEEPIGWDEQEEMEECNE